MFAAALLATGFPHLPQASLASEGTVSISFGAHGAIQIRLRPDLSPESAAFMHEAAEASCGGELYRSESFLMQGRISCHHANTVVKKGPCPPGTPTDPHRVCPSHDPQW